MPDDFGFRFGIVIADLRQINPDLFFGLEFVLQGNRVNNTSSFPASKPQFAVLILERVKPLEDVIGQPIFLMKAVEYHTFSRDEVDAVFRTHPEVSLLVLHNAHDRVAGKPLPFGDDLDRIRLRVVEVEPSQQRAQP